MDTQTRAEEEARGLSRRDLLKRAGIVGVAVAVPAAATSSQAAKPKEREALESFTPPRRRPSRRSSTA